MYSIVKLRWPLGPPTGMKMGGRRRLFGNSVTRTSELFNFQRSVSHCRRHLTMRTAGFGIAPRILFTRQRTAARFTSRLHHTLDGIQDLPQGRTKVWKTPD